MITKEQALQSLESMEEYIEQADKKIKAFEKLLESCEECTDFDGWLAFMISAEDYHEALSIYEEES